MQEEGRPGNEARVSITCGPQNILVVTTTVAILYRNIRYVHVHVYIYHTKTAVLHENVVSGCSELVRSHHVYMYYNK